MSVRESEKLIKSLKGARGNASGAHRKMSVQGAVLQDLEKQMGMHFNTAVKIAHGAKKRKITIEYKGNDDLNRMLERIGFFYGWFTSLSILMKE